MFQSELNTISQFIIDNNPYFDKGYADVYQDDKTGIVHGDEAVFPADNLGNYFYLRLPKQTGFDTSDFYKINDCNGGLGLKASIVLVACVKDADPDKLIENLIITLRNYSSGVVINFKSLCFNGVEVIMTELAKLKPEDLIAALQRFDKMAQTIVSVTFEMTTAVTPKNLDCIVEPCKDC